MVQGVRSRCEALETLKTLSNRGLVVTLAVRLKRQLHSRTPRLRSDKNAALGDQSMEFRCEENLSAQSVSYRLSGRFDESARLPVIKTFPDIEIDLQEVQRLNSIGTRTWCNWVRYPENS